MDNGAVGVIDDRTEDSRTDADGFRVAAFFDLNILVLELAQYASAGWSAPARANFPLFDNGALLPDEPEFFVRP
jgi:hypothetical protein